MKKMPLLIATVMLVAVMSAFTTKKPTQLFYRESVDQFKEILGDGSCEPGSFYCTYTWIGAGDPGSTNNPADYSPQGVSSRIFVPEP